MRSWRSSSSSSPVSGRCRCRTRNITTSRPSANRIKSVPMLAPRGRILDRDGRVIVDNHCLIQPDSVPRKPQTRAPAAHRRRDSDLDYDDLAEAPGALPRRPKYEPMVIKEELTPADLAFVDSHRDFFPGDGADSGAAAPLPAERHGGARHRATPAKSASRSSNIPEFAKYNPGDVIGQVRHRAAVQRHADGRGRPAAGGGG